MRKAYTLLDLLGDFGGFNDAILFLFSLPMGFYASSMYSLDIAGLFKPQNMRQKKQGETVLLKELSSKDRSSDKLHENEKALIFGSMLTGAADSVRLTFFKALCYCKWLCKRNRELRIQNAANERFDEALDVKALYQNYMNLKLLIDVILNNA